MDAAVDRYLTWLAAERRLSSHTLAAYGRDCAALAQFLHYFGLVDKNKLVAC